MPLTGRIEFGKEQNNLNIEHRKFEIFEKIGLRFKQD
jgi:hypothetical protein